MARFIGKIWGVLVITSLLVAQVRGASARVDSSPNSPTAFAPPVLLAPSDGAHTNNATPTFSWVDQTAASYQFQLSQTTDFTPPVVLDETLVAPSFTPGANLAENTYYWRVQSFDGVDWSGWSATWSLTIDTTAPPAPVLSSPPDGVLTNDNWVGFDWGAVIGAGAYHLQAATDMGFAAIVIDQNLADTHYSAGPLVDGTYYWRVNATDLASNTGGWSAVRSLVIDTTPPPVPGLLTPADASFTNDNTPTFTWSASTSASLYTLQVSTVPDFTSAVVNQSQNVTTFSPVTSLADGLYYWRVNATDGFGNASEWSLVRNFTVDTTLPPVPGLVSPAVGASTNDSTPDLTWEISNGASQYQVQVNSNNNFNNPFINQFVGGTIFTPLSALSDGTYYWRVQALDAAGNQSGFSASRSFTVDTVAPNAPNLSSPGVNALLNDNTPAFAWSTSAGASQYQVQVDDNNDFTSMVIDQLVPVSNFTPLSAIPDGIYFWRVRAIDAAGNLGNYATVRSFTIDTTPPGVPGLLLPADGSLTNDSTPAFSWSSVTGANQYTLQVSVSNTFSPLVVNQVLPGTSFSPGNSLADGTYYWRVNATDLAGNTSAWSDPLWTLTIDASPPAAPSLVAPADNSFTNNNIPTFSWNTVADAVQYQLQVSVNSNFSSLAIDQSQAGLTYTPLSSLGDSLYYWRVRSIDTAGNFSSWSLVRTLTVDTLSPLAPVLTSPPDGSLSANNTPAFTWNASAGASQYRLQVDNNNNFLTPEIDQWTAATSFTPVSQLVDGTYFWHVQAVDAAGNLSGWSTAWSVVIDSIAPGVPGLLSPGDASLTNDNTPAFSWSPVAGASSYTFQVSTMADFSNLVINQSQGGTSYTPGAPLADGVYYWRVNALDSIGNPSAWSAVWSFTIDTASPLAPNLLAPVDASFTSDNTPSFSWSASVGASQYTLQVSTVNNFTSTVIDQAQPGTSFAPISPLIDGIYYWRVNAADSAGNVSAWSATRSFTVDTLPPGVPELLVPADAAPLADVTPEFGWSTVVGAVSYRLQIDTDTNFADPILQNQVVNGTSFIMITPMTEGVYYWRVRASDAAGNNSPYSPVRTFTIDTTPPSTPVLATPANGSSTSDTTPAFTWNASNGASQYQVQVDDANDFLSPLLSELTGTPSFTPLASLADGTYYWHVRAIDAAGNQSGWSATWSLGIDATGPAMPVLTAPLDGAFTNDNTPTFSWNAVAGAVQYHIQADDDITFASLRYEQLTASTSATPASSLSDALLYWRVRARDAVGNWGAWSALRSFTIDTVPPAAPTLVAPLDGTISANNMPVFSWSSVTGAVSYQLMVDTSGGFSSPYIIDQALNDLSYAAPNAIADGNYIWRVRANDAAGNSSSWSSSRSFTIDTTASTIPTLVEPANGGITADPTPTFTWGASTGAVLYFIQVDNDSNFSSPLINTNPANTSYTPSTPLGDGTYFWHIQAKDAANNLSGWSATWSVVIDNTPPGVPLLVSPSDGLVTNDNTPTFTWNIPSGAVQTKIQVDDNNDFSTPLVQQTVGGSNFTWDTTFADGSYFWRLQALDAAGNQSNWSAVRSVSIDTTPPAVPQLLAPGPGANTVDNTPTFEWSQPVGASQYLLQAFTGENFEILVIDQTVVQGSFTALPLAQGLYRWRVKAGDAAGNWTAAWSDPRELMVYSFINPVYSEGFESGALGKGWSVILRNEGRVRLARNQDLVAGAVHAGTYSLFLDDAVPGGTQNSQAVAVLTANLAEMSIANLSFFWRGFANANSSADGVYISEDYGANWCRIVEFNDPQKAYVEVKLDLVAEAKTCGLKLNDHFQIKFQFWGFYGINDGANADGYGIDTLRLFAVKPVAYLPVIRR